jgi:hypothetical protein
LDGTVSGSEKPWKTRLVKDEFAGREFDIEFWQEQGDDPHYGRSVLVTNKKATGRSSDLEHLKRISRERRP